MKIVAFLEWLSIVKSPLMQSLNERLWTGLDPFFALCALEYLKGKRQTFSIQQTEQSFPWVSQCESDI